MAQKINQSQSAIKPIYHRINNGTTSRSTGPASGTATIPGSTFTYTSGSSPEKLYLTQNIMCNKGGGAAIRVWLLMDGVEVGPTTYFDQALWDVQAVSNPPYSLAANTTVTISCKWLGSTSSTVTNATTDVNVYPAHISGYALVGA